MKNEFEILIEKTRVRKQENIARSTAAELKHIRDKYGLTKDEFKHEVSFAAHTQELLAATLKYALLPYKITLPGIMNYSLQGNKMLRAMEMLSGETERKSPIGKTQRYYVKRWKEVLHKYTYLKEPPGIEDMIKILKARGMYENMRLNAKRK